MSEEQSTIMFATPGGEHIEVAIERNTASRQADEKRLRNAGASARFRLRKKEKDQHKDSAIERLQAQNRELERRIRELESERETYRADRDRLRDVVYRTPSISDLAYQGPRSPALRGAASFTGRPALEGVPPPPRLPATVYGAGDPVTGERSSRRRRTDPQLDYSPSTYAAALPPPNYNAPMSQPGTPSAGAGPERLPPLRLEQHSGAQAPAHLPTSNAPPQSFSPVKRESYETGWATQPSGPRRDLGQR
ncbi:hypothetical protein TruAng_010741 [Truncatella angustata]|nr:hypothetical protein TruAng_010741 [Truncatella angustata]